MYNKNNLSITNFGTHLIIKKYEDNSYRFIFSRYETDSFLTIDEKEYKNFLDLFVYKKQYVSPFWQKIITFINNNVLFDYNKQYYEFNREDIGNYLRILEGLKDV